MLAVDDFFSGHEDSRKIFEAVRAAVLSLGPVEIRVTKSQVAFRRATGFAYAWMPAKYMHRGDVLLVLTVGLRRHDSSPRWKQVVKPAPGHYIHHLELRSEYEVDEQVHLWLKEAWETAA